MSTCIFYIRKKINASFIIYITDPDVLLHLCQADLSSDTEEGSNVFYGVSSQYSGTENITISVSTKVCSFGKQVVEKVEVSRTPFIGILYILFPINTTFVSASD